MEEQVPDNKNIFYPPGGILIWLIIFIELITFSLGLIAMAYFAKTESELFHTSCSTLHKNIALVNTLILLSSSYFMANTIQQIQNKMKNKAARYLGFTIVLGLLFVCLKSSEYYLEIQAGQLLSTNIFFTFYWLLTGFHLIHIAIGLSILIYFYNAIKKNKTFLTSDLIAGAAFWHMCDLIWLLLFPIIYLIF